MPRYKLTLEYDGTGFVGWQRQDNGLSVQAVLEQAAQRLTGSAVTAVAAGRTDSGVHATGQVAHVDLVKPLPPDKVRDALNFHMQPHAVAVVAAAAVDDTFHARFSAQGRSYLYRIICRRPPLVLDRDRAWRVPMDLDVDAMRQGAQHLLGSHDFTSFRASECQAKSPIRTLEVLRVSRHGPEIRIEAEARSFLHHQVRNIVGTLKLVGEGKWQPDDVARARDARDRKAGGPTAPPNGLYFTGVKY
jgi:tRNA pseudouridine38-40 synthase